MAFWLAADSIASNGISQNRHQMKGKRTPTSMRRMQLRCEGTTNSHPHWQALHHPAGGHMHGGNRRPAEGRGQLMAATTAQRWLVPVCALSCPPCTLYVADAPISPSAQTSAGHGRAARCSDELFRRCRRQLEGPSVSRPHRQRTRCQHASVSPHPRPRGSCWQQAPDEARSNPKRKTQRRRQTCTLAARRL
jgi:hypothetical protein